MAKYRKKPVVIEAIQYNGNPDSLRGIPGIVFDDEYIPHIETLEGNMCISPKDFIITGIQGEKYPCKPDIFEATYERV